MQLWLAGILIATVAAVMSLLIVCARRKGKKAWTIAAITACGAVILALLLYIALAFIFIEAASNQPPDEPPETSAAMASTPVPTRTSPSASPIAPTATPLPHTPPPPTPIPLPDDYDLPIAEVPALHPDVLGLRDVKYEEMPTFSTQNETTKYVLYNFLNGRMECELYLTKDFALDEGTGHGILSDACETAMSYYLLSAFFEYDMFTEDRGDEGKVYARVKLIYTNPDYDLEAQAEALEFVLKNPVPAGGFKDFDAEKAYARKIHDFIALKVTYSPIGYDPESMFGMRKYEALQEAYNALAETENTVVCAGYARAFALIAQYAGINVSWVFGNETETSSHAWNVVYPCDRSEAVVVDVTWDDTDSDDSPEQEYVSDRWFYIPLSEEYEHTPTDSFDEFLRFVNER